MAKEIGYTFAIKTQKPSKTFVFCRWFSGLDAAVRYAEQQIADRGHLDVEYILIREGTTNADDPIIWDSRKDRKTEPVVTPLQQLRAKVDELYNRNEFDTLCYDELVNLINQLS